VKPEAGFIDRELIVERQQDRRDDALGNEAVVTGHHGLLPASGGGA
jgi:hypothetical protein